MRLVLLICFCIISLAQLTAQVEPPELLCLRDDSLFWEVPSNSCGPFIGYEIYVSNSGPQGPFLLLTTVTDPVATSYYHDNQLSEVRYYYMVSVYDCPGETATPSDTVSNQLPVAMPILGASVNGFFFGPSQPGVTLTWSSSPSPETIGYIIYQNTPQGTIPVDTVFDTETWSSQNADAETVQQTFYVLALDACGNVSLFGEPHTTMLLDYTISVCRQAADLSWSPYEGWPDGVGSYEIVVSENGNPGEVVATVTGGQTSASLLGLTDQVDYRIVIRAVKADGQAVAYSPTAEFSTEIVQPITQLEIFQVTVGSDGRPNLSWRWNANAELTSAIIWGFRESDNIAVAIDDYPVGSPLDANPSTALNWKTDEEQTYYFLETTDNCDSVVRSLTVSPIFLTVKNLGPLSNQLIWKPLQLPGAAYGEYEIYRVQSNGISAQLIGTVDAATQTYIDELGSVGQSGSSCYVVRTKGKFRFQSDQSESDFESQSNVACAAREVLVYLPNAFAPNGRNPEFKAIPVAGADVREFQLSIYNRWGTQVFVTNQINTGWDGNYNGQEQPAGLYTFRLQLKNNSGKMVVEKGTLLLLR